MPVITSIVEQKRRPNRRSIHMDGRFAFGCHVNVVAKFKLKVGLQLAPAQVESVLQGEVRQQVFDDAMRLLQRRLQSRAELHRKLVRKQHSRELIEAVLDDLARLGYVDDARFARTRAAASAEHRQHGRRRAVVELLKSGIERETARRAVEDVYESHDSLEVARKLAQKKAPSLRKLDPMVARRRLAGMLARRGFEYDVVRPVIDEVVGSFHDDHNSE